MQDSSLADQGHDKRERVITSILCRDYGAVKTGSKGGDGLFEVALYEEDMGFDPILRSILSEKVAWVGILLYRSHPCTPLCRRYRIWPYTGKWDQHPFTFFHLHPDTSPLRREPARVERSCNIKPVGKSIFTAYGCGSCTGNEFHACNAEFTPRNGVFRDDSADIVVTGGDCPGNERPVFIEVGRHGYDGNISDDVEP